MFEKMKKREESLNAILREASKIEVNTISHLKNGHEIYGYAMRQPGSSVSAVIYYDDSWEQLSDEELARYLYIKTKGATLPELDTEIFNNREKLLSKAFPRLTSAENSENLEKKGLVHYEIEDLSVYFSVEISSENEAVGTTNITKDMAAAIGISFEELKEAAIKNIEKTSTIRNIVDVLSDLTRGEMPVPEPADVLLVVTTSSGSLGAGCILSEKVRKELAARIGDEEGRFIMLPSSIHETLALKYSKDRLAFVTEMVKEVNETQVMEEERLTDSAYICQNGQIKRIREEELDG